MIEVYTISGLSQGGNENIWGDRALDLDELIEPYNHVSKMG